MVSYYKNAQRWQREQRSGSQPAAPDLNFVRDKTTGEFKLPPKRASPVPSTGPAYQKPPTGSPSEFKKQWRDLPPSGSNPLGKWRGIGGGALGFLMRNQDELWKLDRSDWDHFMETGNFPPPFDFLNPSDDARKRFNELNGIPMPITTGDPDAPGEVYVNGYTLLQACQGDPGLPDLFGLGSSFTQRSGICGMQIPQNDGRFASPQAVFNEHGFWPNPLGMGENYFSNWRFHSFWSRNVGETPDGTWGTLPATTTVTIPGSHINGDWSTPWLLNPNARNPTQQPKKSARQKRVEKAVAEMTGNRYDSGYSPDKMPWEENPTETTVITVPYNPDDPRTGPKPPGWPPPTHTKPKTPYKPPGTPPDKKIYFNLYALFKAAQRGFHAITEYDDFIESFYDALPKKYQTCKIGGPACKTAVVFAHWDEVDIPVAVVNWLWNDFEDRMLGKHFFGRMDKAAKRLGTRDWKLLNSANDMPLDAALGEAYGEFVKEHVNPTKEKFVSWAKENLLK